MAGRSRLRTRKRTIRAGGGGGPVTSAVLLEDGTSFLLLEDGTSKLLLE